MNTELTFRSSLAILLIVLLAIRYRYTGWDWTGLTARKGVESNNTNVGRRIAILFFGWLSLLIPIVYILMPQWVAWASLRLPIWLLEVGIIVGISGALMFLGVSQTLGQNWNVPAAIKGQQTLITTRIYRWIRHPMYTSFAIIGLAYFLISSSGLIAVICIGMAIVILTTLPLEEAALIEKFGAIYREYMRHTGRFLPRVFNGG